MKTIGLIGGMSWESTVTYYQLMNQSVKEALGGLHSARILLHSVDFQEIVNCQASGDWDKSAAILSDAAKRLEQAGADCVLICTNTMHKVAPAVQAAIAIPLLHIAEATAKELRAHQISKVALLGTRFTMQQDFYKEKLAEAGIEVLIPGEDDMDRINHSIFDELCLGILSQDTKRDYQRIMAQMKDKGAQGVILGCTEIGLLVKQEDSDLPVFDTTLIHSRQAVKFALGG